MDAMREAAVIQEEYQRLVDEQKLTKRSMCELCVPFRDKYGLTDLQTLRIARKEMDLMEMIDLLQPEKCSRCRLRYCCDEMHGHNCKSLRYAYFCGEDGHGTL